MCGWNAYTFGNPAVHKALEVCPTQLLRSKSHRLTFEAYLLIAVALTLLISIDHVPFFPKYVLQFTSASLIEFRHVSDKLAAFWTLPSGPTETNELPFSSVIELCPHHSFSPVVLAELTLMFCPPPLNKVAKSPILARAQKPYPIFSRAELPLFPIYPHSL